MYVQFSFYYRVQSLGFFSNNWIEYKSTRAPVLLCKTRLTHSTPTEMRQQSSIDINLQQVCDLSVVQPMCVRALAHYNTRMYAASIYNNLRITSELLGFSLQDQLISSATNLSFSFVSHYPNWPPTSHNTSNLSNSLLMLHNQSIWMLLNHA